MKYIVIELQTNADGEVANIVTKRDTLKEAESTYYSILSAAALSDIPTHGAIIVSEECVPVRHDFYKH